MGFLVSLLPQEQRKTPIATTAWVNSYSPTVMQPAQVHSFLPLCEPIADTTAQAYPSPTSPPHHHCCTNPPPKPIYWDCHADSKLTRLPAMLSYPKDPGCLHHFCSNQSNGGKGSQAGTQTWPMDIPCLLCQMYLLPVKVHSSLNQLASKGATLPYSSVIMGMKITLSIS